MEDPLFIINLFLIETKKKKVSDYDQEMPQSQTANQPTALRERHT